jgi:hypothetical protein
MGRLTLKLTETASKVTTTTNEYNDVVMGTTSPSPCLYRDISILQHSPNRDDVNLDGIIWFDADEVVAKGDIYYHPIEGYLQIERITRAKDLLRSNTVQFIKCGITKQRQVS